MLKIHWDDASMRRMEPEEWLKAWSKILEWIVEGGGVGTFGGV